ncbi:Hypothetical predicted protein [Pelobates cultripes]|nr:Hypothetical predicted protein [Pelobates cultripes]
MTDGSGIIDLAALGDSEGFLIRDRKIQRAFGDRWLEESITLSSCNSFSKPEAALNCSHVLLCVKTRDLMVPGSVPYYLGYGLYNNNEYSYNNESKTLSLTYQALSDTSLRAIVHFNCSPSSSITFPSDSQNWDNMEIFVESPCACPSHCQMGNVGPGTIMLIIFALSTTVYFLFGSCGLRSIRTSEGDQIAPVPHFWCWMCTMFSKEKDIWKGMGESGSREATMA